MSVFTPAIREFLAVPDEARRLGPYRCKDLLDKAGSAPVFRAVEEHAGLALREVAIKVFDIGKSGPTANVGEGFQSRVVDEARSLCGVQHPNVIRFHTLYTDAKRGLMGIVMEFASGVSVERQLEALPADPVRRVALAVEIGINISSALAAAHEAGVAHCNVKPSNIMFTDGTHKLINFGIAASVSPLSERSEERRRALMVEDLGPESIGKKASTLESATVPSSPITGTIGYADPTCLRTTSPPTASSDLYSLGATLYQVVAGDVPSVATKKQGGATGVDSKVLTGEAAPASLVDVAPGTRPELAKLIDSLVAPSPKDRPRSADAVRSAFERIRSALAGHERALPSEERGPFVGLERYEARDRDVFFGRSAEVAGMIEVLRTRGLIGLVGLSGTGKSSLVRAGVVPAIEEGALEGWPTRYRSVFITPGDDLMGSIEASLSSVIEAPLETHAEAIVQQLVADVDAKSSGIVLVVDQLEEIVTQHDAKRDEGRSVALELLSRLAEAPVGLRVIVTARRDLLDEILAIDPHFARAFSRGIQLLGPLSGAAWEEVLDRSLEAYGYAFEDAELRRTVLTDIRERESAMALVQFGLARLWAARDEEAKRITRAAFGAKGGARGALEQHAGATVSELKVPQEKLREVLLAMTTPEGTSAHVTLDDLVRRCGEPARDVVRALMKARLLMEEKSGVTFVHDSILREWGLLRGWLQEARDDRLLSAQLERDAARWSESKDAADLWRKGRLSAGLDLEKRPAVKLSPQAHAFLRSSAGEERKVKVAFWSLGILVVSLVVGGALFYAKISRDAAEQARKDADALAAALAEVKTLKRQTEEQAMEAATSAALLADLEKKMAEERAQYGTKVNAAIKKVVSATNLETAQKATEDLKAPAPAQNPVIPVGLNLAGLTGPSSGPSAGVFDSAAIERVVNTRKAGVKRVCLERSTSMASSTKVTATITIAPSGAVQDVTSTGNEPAVGKCIEQQMRSWTFPPPGEVKTVQIPFVFVRQ